MKKALTWILIIVITINIINVKTLTISANVNDSETPDYNIWNAETVMYGFENDTSSLYKLFLDFEEPVYKQLGGYLLEDKPLVTLSAMWSNCFNDEYRDHLRKEEKYIYEILLMNYLKQNAEENASVDILNNYTEFSTELYSALCEEVVDHTEIVGMTVEEALDTLDNVKTIKNLGEAVAVTKEGVEDVEDLINAVSEYLALQKTKEECVTLLKTAREECDRSEYRNEDFIKAADEIISILESSAIEYSARKTMVFLWEKVLDTSWDILRDKNPVLNGIVLTTEGLDALFNTSDSASNNLKLALLYTTDCYMKLGLISAANDFRNEKSSESGKAFLSCFKGYLEFQMYGNDYSQEWLEQYLDSGAFSNAWNLLFEQDNIKTAQELIARGESQKERRQMLLELIEKYSKRYKNLYAIQKSGSDKNGNSQALFNPSHHCDLENEGQSDYTNYSYVYFGSYPQKEITDSVTISKINDALTKEGKTKGDIRVDKVKYRKIDKDDVANDERFCEEISATYRYFKWEPIEWKVLWTDGEKAFLVAKKALDCREYNEEYDGVTWASSTIRYWLNGLTVFDDDGVTANYGSTGFYETAFSEAQQKKILDSKLTNGNNPEHGTSGGVSTTDKIFLLSQPDVANENYGFCSNPTVTSSTRWVQPTDYSRAMGTFAWTEDTYEGISGNCWWWLRSPGADTDDAMYVDDGGVVDNDGYGVDYCDGVVPAMWVKLPIIDSLGESTLTIDEASDTLIGNEAKITGTYALPDGTDSNMLSDLVSAIKWTSSDQSIVEDSDILWNATKINDRSKGLTVFFTPKKEGTFTIRGITEDGVVARCVVTVKNEIERIKTVGKLTAVNHSKMTVTIDGKENEVTDAFDLGVPVGYLQESPKGIVVIATYINGKLAEMERAETLLEPRIKVTVSTVRKKGNGASESVIGYMDGKFEKADIKAEVEVSVGLKGNIKLNKMDEYADQLSLSFDQLEIVTGNDWKIKNTFTSSGSKILKQNFSLKMKDTLNETVYLQMSDSYSPKEEEAVVKLSVRAQSGNGNETEEGTLKVINLDQKLENISDKELQQKIDFMVKRLDQIAVPYDTNELKKCGYTDNQIKDLNNALKFWIIEKMSSVKLSGNSIWNEMSKQCTTELQKRIFDKCIDRTLDATGCSGLKQLLNLDTMVSVSGKITDETQIWIFDETGKKHDTIKVKMDTADMTFNGKTGSFAKWGNITLSKDGKILATGGVFGANVQQFSDDLADLYSKQIKDIWDEMIKNVGLFDFADAAIEKYFVKRLSMGSEGVDYKLFKKAVSKCCKKVSSKVYCYIYQESTKIGKTAYTAGKVKCPVDIYIYDRTGALCGSVINDEVVTDIGEITLLVKGNEKYFVVVGDDYSITFVGNDTGSMTYSIENYEGEELVNAVTYTGVPLEKGKTYQGFIPEYTVDSEMYNLLSLSDGKIIQYDGAQEEKKETEQVVADTGKTEGTKSEEKSKISIKKPVISKVKGTNKSFKATWKKVSDTDGYEFQYSLKKNFKSAKSKNLSAKKTSFTAKRLKAGKKYYVRIRAYKTINGFKQYSDWSKTKSVKVKKK